jgi:hypothetical protein
MIGYDVTDLLSCSLSDVLFAVNVLISRNYLLFNLSSSARRQNIQVFNAMSGLESQRNSQSCFLNFVCNRNIENSFDLVVLQIKSEISESFSSIS